LDSTGSGQGPVAGCCECGDEPSGSGATELVILQCFFSNEYYVALNNRAISEWGKDLEQSSRGPIVRYYPGIHLKGLGKNNEKLQ
jgi:hypothetical protein